MQKTIIIVLVSFISLLSGRAQEIQKPVNDITRSWDKYEICQFISTSGSSPQSIMNLDNNGEILLACLSGKTADQLRVKDIKILESQIRLLKDWGLMKEENDTLTTTFPILDENNTKELRNHSREIASILAKDLEDDVIRLTKKLESLQREKNIYTILFSYVMDDLGWEILKKRKMEQRKITLENPYWSGVIWAINPPRIFSCGTNSITDQGVTFYVNWSERTIKKMVPFIADWKNFGKMFDDYLLKGFVEDINAFEVFAPFNLFDSSGQFTVPVIEEKAGDPLYEICHAISEKIADRVPGLINISEIDKSFGFANNEEALVVLYHELMWDLLDYFEKQQLIQKPIAFSDPDMAESKDIADLVFIVNNNQSYK